MLLTLASLLQSAHPNPNGVSQQAGSFLILIWKLLLPCGNYKVTRKTVGLLEYSRKNRLTLYTYTVVEVEILQGLNGKRFYRSIIPGR